MLEPKSRLSVRIPHDLHERIKAKAAEREETDTAWVIRALEAQLAADDGLDLAELRRRLQAAEGALHAALLAAGVVSSDPPPGHRG